MPMLKSPLVRTAPPACQKLGQPVPESNFEDESKSAAPQQAHLYVPFSLQPRYAPVNGGSVAPLTHTSYCSGESLERSFSVSTAAARAARYIYLRRFLYSAPFSDSSLPSRAPDPANLTILARDGLTLRMWPCMRAAARR